MLTTGTTRCIIKARRALLPCLILLCAALLCGCALRLRFTNGRVSQAAREISLVLEPGESALLDSLPNLRSADLSGSECYEEIMDWAAAHPDIAVRYTVPMPDGSEPDNAAQKLDLSAAPAGTELETAKRLRFLPGVETVILGGETEGADIKSLAAFGESRADIEYDYAFDLCGKSCNATDRTLDLRGADRADIEKLKQVLPVMTALEAVSLGDQTGTPALTFADIAEFQRLRPGAKFDYGFTLYGRDFSTLDTEMNFSHVPMTDEGAAVMEAAACMPNLEYLDMDSCGVSNEAMAEIRDALPDTNVVWRVWFGGSYSVRTDVEKILASKPTVGGNLTAENSQALRYCTKVKYLDLGHNEILDDISFVSFMPELEVAVLALNNWSDTSPLADCPHLEYLEIQTTNVSDITPLAGLKELRHLNIAYLFNLTDISPLYGLTELERLWIGCLDPVPAEQIEHMQECAPDCVINTTVSDDPTSGGWRYTGKYNSDGTAELAERYKLLREQFGYDKLEYSFSWNDPLY